MPPMTAVHITASAPLSLPQLSPVLPQISKSGLFSWKLALSPRESDGLLEQVRREFFSPAIDIAFLESTFQPRAFFFDMDSTVIEQESIVEIARTIGKAEEVSRITQAAMAGQLPFKEALLTRLAFLKGVPSTIFSEIFSKLTCTPGIETLLHFAKSQQIPTFLVSGGFTDLAEPLAKRLGFTGIHANQLEKKKDTLTGKIVGTIVDGDDKAQFVASKAQELGLSRNEIVVVGDGANDLKMMGLSNCAAGFRPKAMLYPYLHVCMGRGDHRFLAEVLAGSDSNWTSNS